MCRQILCTLEITIVNKDNDYLKYSYNKVYHLTEFN